MPIVYAMPTWALSRGMRPARSGDFALAMIRFANGNSARWIQVSSLPPERPTVVRALRQVCRLCIRCGHSGCSSRKAVDFPSRHGEHVRAKMGRTRARRYANHHGSRRSFGSSRTSYRDGSMASTTQPSAKASSTSFRVTASRPLFARLGVRLYSQTIRSANMPFTVRMMQHSPEWDQRRF